MKSGHRANSFHLCTVRLHSACVCVCVSRVPQHGLAPRRPTCAAVVPCQCRCPEAAGCGRSVGRSVGRSGGRAIGRSVGRSVAHLTVSCPPAGERGRHGRGPPGPDLMEGVWRWRPLLYSGRTTIRPAERLQCRAIVAGVTQARGGSIRMDSGTERGCTTSRRGGGVHRGEMR